MKGILLLFVVSLLMVAGGAAQTPSPTPEQPKTISAPSPVFPEEAKKFIYGESVRVLVAVDKKGAVDRAIVYGPLAPCSNLKDPIVESIRDEALKTAKKTTFEPLLKDGKPVEATLSVSYRLRPRVEKVTGEKKKVIYGGVLNGKALELPKPGYSAKARANRLGGTIEINVMIGEDGRILSAGAWSGHPDLIGGALDSACAARYSPTTLAGEPVKVMGRIVYNFVP